MHPTRQSLSDQRRNANRMPKGERLGARTGRVPIAMFSILVGLMVSLGILVAFHVTHEGRLPRDRYELMTWLKSPR